MEDSLLHTYFCQQELLTVSVLAQRSDMWADLVHEDLALCRLSHIDHLLNDVVSVLVLHEYQQRAVSTIVVAAAHLHTTQL